MTPQKTKKVYDYFKKRGLRILVKPANEVVADKDHSLAPFVSYPARAAVNWKDKVLLLTSDIARNANIIIHEAGHVLASKANPSNAEEGDFLGWEAVTAKKLGVYREWVENNKDYWYTFEGNDTCGEIYEAGPETIARFLKEITKIGQKYGNIDGRGNPVSVR